MKIGGLEERSFPCPAIAASVLQADGLANVINLAGGFAEWQKQKRPVQSERSVREEQTAREMFAAS